MNRQKPLKTGGGEGGAWQEDRAHVGCATQAGIPPFVETRTSETILKRPPVLAMPEREQGCSAYLVHLGYEISPASHAESQQVVELLRVA